MSGSDRISRRIWLFIAVISSLLVFHSNTGWTDFPGTYCSEIADATERAQEEGLRGLDIRDRDFSETDFVLRNLTDVKLINAKLRGVDFSCAILNSAKLSGADMTNTKLVNSYLYRTDLSEAILVNANLENAMLWLTELQGANLTGANLEGARLWGANLNSANLSYANLTGADFSRANLTNTTTIDAVFCNTIMPTGYRNNRDCN